MGIRRMNHPSPTPRAALLLEQAQSLRARYEAGATVDQLAAATGLSHGTIINRLHTAETTMRTPQQTRQLRAADQAAARRELARELRARYEAGGTVTALATECGLSSRTVRRLLVQAGATLRSPHQTRRLHTTKDQVAARQHLMTALRRRYEAGEPVPALAASCGRSVSTVYRLLHQAGTTLRPQHQHEPFSHPMAQPP
jgi:transposase